MQASDLRISYSLWKKLIAELKKRGRGNRESGAFLLGRLDNNEIIQFVCYDDLDPNCLETGMIIFNGEAIVPLWNDCNKNSLTVLADIHTHPREWVRQSEADETHPTISQPGHIAIIIPYYATKKRYSLKGVGIYKYLGDHKWETYKNNSLALKIFK